MARVWRSFVRRGRNCWTETLELEQEAISVVEETMVGEHHHHHHHHRNKRRNRGLFSVRGLVTVATIAMAARAASDRRSNNNNNKTTKALWPNMTFMGFGTSPSTNEFEGKKCGRGCRYTQSSTTKFTQIPPRNRDFFATDLLEACDDVLPVLEEMGFVYLVAKMNLSGNIIKLRNAGAEGQRSLRSILLDDARENHELWDTDKTQPSCALPDSATCASLWLIRTLRMMRDVLMKCGVESGEEPPFDNAACVREVYRETLAPLFHDVWRAIADQVLAHTCSRTVLFGKLGYDEEDMARKTLREWSMAVDRVLLNFERIERELRGIYGKDMIV